MRFMHRKPGHATRLLAEENPVPTTPAPEISAAERTLLESIMTENPGTEPNTQPNPQRPARTQSWQLRLGGALAATACAAVVVASLPTTQNLPVLTITNNGRDVKSTAAAGMDAELADARLWMGNYEFVKGEDVVLNAGKQPVYEMALPENLRDEAARLARVLGITAPLQSIEMPQYTIGAPEARDVSVTSSTVANTGEMYQAGSYDDDEGMFNLYADGLGSFNFSRSTEGYFSCGSATSISKEPVAVAAPDVKPQPGDEQAGLVDEINQSCQPRTLIGVPNADEARAQGRALLSKIAPDRQFRISVVDESYGIILRADLVVAGTVTQLSWIISYGENAQLTNLNGFLATPRELAEYPTLSSDEAFALLQKQYETTGGTYRGGVDTAVQPMSTGATAVSETEEGPVNAGATEGSSGSGGGSVEAVPPSPSDDEVKASNEEIGSEPKEPMPKITIVITSISLVHTIVYTSEGKAYLVPTYVFSSVEGASWNVYALSEKYLQQR